MRPFGYQSHTDMMLGTSSSMHGTENLPDVAHMQYKRPNGGCECGRSPCSCKENGCVTQNLIELSITSLEKSKEPTSSATACHKWWTRLATRRDKVKSQRGKPTGKEAQCNQPPQRNKGLTGKQVNYRKHTAAAPQKVQLDKNSAQPVKERETGLNPLFTSNKTQKPIKFARNAELSVTSLEKSKEPSSSATAHYRSLARLTTRSGDNVKSQLGKPTGKKAQCDEPRQRNKKSTEKQVNYRKHTAAAPQKVQLEKNSAKPVRQRETRLNPHSTGNKTSKLNKSTENYKNVRAPNTKQVSRVKEKKIAEELPVPTKQEKKQGEKLPSKDEKKKATKLSRKRGPRQRDRITHHIMWDGFDEADEAIGWCCCLCEVDLAYLPVDKKIDESHKTDKLPDIAVLPCGHCFHNRCLQLAIDDTRCFNPCCFICESLSSVQEPTLLIT